MASLTERLYAKAAKEREEEKQRVRNSSVNNAVESMWDRHDGTKTNTKASTTTNENRPTPKLRTDGGSLTERLYAQASREREEEKKRAEASSAPSQKYTSPSEWWKDIDRYESGIKGAEERVSATSEWVSSVQKRLEEAEARFLADQTNEEAYNDYLSAYNVYSRMYGQYEPLQKSYNSAVDEYNSYVADQQSQYDAWRGSIRSVEEIEAEMAEVDKAIKSNKWDQWGLAFGGNGEAWQDKEKEQAALREKYKLLSEELEYSRYFGYGDLAENADYATMSLPGESKRGDNFFERLFDNHTATAYDYINNIGGFGDAKRDEGFVKSLTSESNMANATGFEAYDFMNDEQKATFNYIYNTQGREAAQEYLDYLLDSPLLGQDALNYQYGQKIASGLNNDFQRAAYGLTAGINQFGAGLMQLGSGEAVPTSAIQYANEAGKAELGKVGQFINDAGAVTGNMLPSILFSAATAGLGAPAALASGAGALSLGASAGGNAYNQAIKEGWTPSEAKAYGALVGASEASLQYILGGIGKLGGKATTKLAAKASAIDNALARIAATGAIKIGGEVTEEVLQEFIEPAIRTIIADEKYDAPNAQELIYTVLLTALTTGLMEGGSVVSESLSKNTVRTGIEERAPDEIKPETIKPAEPKKTAPTVTETVAPDVTETEDIVKAAAMEVVNARNEAEQTEEERQEQKPAEAAAPEISERQDVKDGGTSEVADTNDVEARANKAAYEAGRQNVPLEKVTLETEAQENAYIEGRRDAIEANDFQKPVEKDQPEVYTDTNESPATVETVAKNETVSETTAEINNVAEESQKAAEKEPVTEQTTYNEPGISDLSAQLAIRDLAVVDGIKYALDMDSHGGYRVSIDRDTSALGGRVSDARANIYRGGPFATRGEAVREAIEVARNNNLTKRIEEDANNGETTLGEVSDEGRVLESDVSGQSDGELLDELAAQNVQEDEGRGDSVSASSGDGREPSGRAGGSDSLGNERGRSLGSGEGADIQPASGEVTKKTRKNVTADTKKAAKNVTESAEDTSAKETTSADAEIKQKAEIATQEQPKGNNFSIPEAGLNLPKGEKARFKANVEAIKTLRALMSENRRATPEEQAILSKYVGWGGLANAFDEKKTEWAKEYKQLKELLSEQEYASARASTLNAHYTDVGVIRAIYKGLEEIGFKGGRLLEPSAGVGHFAGAIPQGVNASWTMVELDTITGNIAKYLYPNADVRVQGFEKAKIPDNYMDMAISNVPFGNYAIVDKSYPKAVTGAIHNYFFAKALDKVRPGGIVCFITSRFTMDARDPSVRHYIAQRADLLGAIRLPDSAFKGNAGTEVVTDILILKKREAGTPYAGMEFENVGWHHQDLRIYEQTNDYFAEHPEMVLGTPTNTGGMYRGDSLTYTALPGNLTKQIEKAFSSIKGKMDYPVRQTQEEIRAEIKQNAGKAKNGAIVKKDGKLYRNKDGVLETVAELNEKTAAIVSDIVEIRDLARDLLNLQLDGVKESQIAETRKKLNKQYDAFVKKNGIFNSTTNKRLINLDIDAPFILALEEYNKDTKTAKKAAIFTKNTITPVKTVTHVNTLEEGLTVSMNELGTVDAKRIAELLGDSEANVTRMLLDHRLAFKNRNGVLETAEQYLSGNVKAKLRDAEALAEGDSDYLANVEELKKIIPADIPAEDISVQPGSTWIPDSVYSDFVAETLGTRNYEWKNNAVVTYNKVLGVFNVTVTDKWLKSRPENISTWGTEDRSFINIFEATLNNKNVTVWRKMEDGSRVLDKQATAAAQEKQEKIRAEFSRWLWDDDSRKESLARLYNDIFNNTVTPKYDGTHLTVNGANAEKPLRPHQRDAVQRIINSGGNTLLAHKVGAGKTYEMAAAAMKLRQLGIVKKPMFVVPKSLVAQWGNEFLDFFPAAKILVLGEKDFSAANRKLFANRIATGDYDAVILSQEQFKAVPMSVDNQEAFYQDQITALELAMAETARANGKRDPSIKQMERSKKSFEAKLKKLGDMKKDEDNIDFEQLGVDAIFVDEAHSYKNLFYTTNMNNVSGLGNKEGSQKAFDLYMKVRYLQGLNGGRGIVFATATPVMNSMSEMYIMQKYLQSDLLEARGLHSFDAWASQFGEVRTVLEMNPSGKGFRQKQSFSRFKNLAELQQMFRAFADVLTDIPGLKIPTMKEGKRIIVESEPSEFQLDFIEKLAERAEAIKGRKVDPKEDNMLKITSEGRKLSYTQRMIDPTLPYEADNKIMKCADNVLKLWEETKDIKGTQLIFCDLSTPKGSSNTETTAEVTEDAEDISIYDDIRNVLIGAGVPAKEIAFIHDANTNDKKAKLFKDVNEGTVRVLIGSTGKMGVGMNAQKRVVALHHLDAPWRPGDIEQREGRALRQGNMNEEVGMYVYVTKQTFDSRMWDNLQRKASFIHQVMAGDLTARESEGDGDFALSAAEIKAISSGNPLIMEQFEVASELSKMENLERAHRKEVSEANKRIMKAKQEIASDEVYIEKLKADVAARKDTSGEKFTITIGGKKFAERKEAGEAIVAEARKRLKVVRDSETATEIGSFAGFKLFVTNSGDVLLRGQAQYRTNVNMQSPMGTIQSLEATVKRIDKTLENATSRLEENKSAISKLEKTAAAPFDKAGELERLRKRNAEIMAELNPADEQNAAALEDDTDDMVDHDKDFTPRPERWTADRVGDDNKKPKTLSEIIEDIKHDFGLNITTGHIRGSGVRGRYSRNDSGIRTKIAQDLPTVAHELGHHIDRTHQITKGLSEELKQELTNGLSEETKDMYPEKKWVTEGFAEYVRKFLQNRETAAIDYPEFTVHFLASLSGKDRVLIEQLADEVNAYYSLDADTAVSSIRLREDGAPDARTAGEKIKDKMSVIYQAWIDSNHGIKQFDKATGANTYKLASNSAYSDAVAGQIIIGDLTDANGQYVAPGLKTALHGLNMSNKTEYLDFGEYLTVKHGPEVLAEGIRIFADDRKNSTAFMERRQEELEQKYPHFKEVSERLYEFQKKFLRTWGVSTGLVSEASAKSWAERWDYYVPLNRVFSKDKQDPGAKRGFANQNSTIKKRRGSGRDIYHPVDNIVNNIVKMVNAGMRNNVMRAITDSAEALGADAGYLELIPTPLVRRSFDMTEVKEKLHESNDDALATGKTTDESWEAFDTIIEELDDILYQYGRGKAHGDVITVLKDGEREFWKINDPQLLSSVTSLDTKKLEGILDAIAVTSRFMTSNITGNNVIWSLFSNFPRDIMTMFVYSKKKNPVKMFSAMGSAYVNKVSDGLGKGVDPLYQEFLAMGGGKTSAYTADRDLAKRARKKLAGKNFSANPLDWVSFASDLIELGPRFATYKVLRNNGFSAQEAFYEAMDITVNFRRSGAISKQINAVVPFFNASVQSLDKFRRWITAEEVNGDGRKKVVAIRTAAYIASSAALAAIVYALNSGDDDDEEAYEQLSNFTKNSYWCIPVGDGKFFCIPKPRELAVLSSFFETCMEYGIGDNDHAFDEFYAYAADNSLPSLFSDLAKGDIAGAIGSLGIIGVGSYMVANRDFLGRPIVSSGLQNLEPKDQYTDRTSKISYWVGQAFNTSPQMVDYFFNSVLGGWWKYQKALFPVGKENVDYTLGVQNTYIKDNQYSTDLVNWLYDKAEASDKAHNSDRSNMDKAITSKMDSNMTSFYSNYYAIAKNEKDTDRNRGVRQTVLSMILEYQKATDSGAVTGAQKTVYDVIKAKGDAQYLPAVMSSTLKDAKGVTHKLTAAQYVEYQTEYNRLYWEGVEDILNGATEKEKAQLILAAKEIAKEQATERALSRIGAPYKYSEWVGKAMDSKDLGLSTAEFVNLKEQYGVSAVTSDTTAKAYNAGVQVENWLKYDAAQEDMKPLKDSDGDDIDGSWKIEAIDYIDNLDLGDKEHDALVAYSMIGGTKVYKNAREEMTGSEFNKFVSGYNDVLDRALDAFADAGWENYDGEAAASMFDKANTFAKEYAMDYVSEDYEAESIVDKTLTLYESGLDFDIIFEAMYKYGSLDAKDENGNTVRNLKKERFYAWMSEKGLTYAQKNAIWKALS